MNNEADNRDVRDVTAQTDASLSEATGAGEKESNGTYMGEGMLLGMLIGTAVMVFVLPGGNPGASMWSLMSMSIGLSIGMAVGLAIPKKPR
ncbi:hypothetical protein CMUST_11390 [Corynebacterium mustelae]|uniref:Uncharacterized protein n=1 Tax=Corynebacterium mustelae TaxID=571915 RepID=A0A0G3GZK6_9CORY|nr:hypothetical protein [Corynebacterium mustelae]AKK06591.1 hypothetical protein CMUST_11390 [Corynebacterium mustelae]